MASSSSSFVTLAGFSGSHWTTIRPFLSPDSQSKITPLEVEPPLSPSYGGLPTSVKTYPFPILFTMTASTRCKLSGRFESEIDKVARLLAALCRTVRQHLRCEGRFRNFGYAHSLIVALV